MSNPFEDLVQLELGKRPFVTADAVEETIFIRRGLAPNQMVQLNIGEGQALAKINGKLTGVNLSDLGGSGGGSVMYTFKQFDTPSAAWTVNHGKNNRYFTYNVFDTTGKSIMPDEVETVDANTVVVSFLTPVKGHIVFSFDPLAAV